MAAKEQFIDHEDVTKYIKENGVKDLKGFMEKKIKEWSKIPLNVGITGSSGAGKSSFINAIRNLDADDEGSAAVGVTETTMEPKSYPHPQNDNLIYWDLPGVGTPKFPREYYLEKVGFKRFDFFVIFSATRFTDDDLWLGRKIEKMGKKFFFSRTKIDADIENDKRAHRKTHNEQKLLDGVRANCHKEFREAGIKQEKVYLVSNFDTGMFDFPDLQRDIVDSLPQMKKAAMTFSLSPSSKSVIRIKREQLEVRIWQVATASAAAAMIPIPGVSIAADAALLVREMNFYKEQFGLDKTTLSTLSGLIDIAKIAKERESFAEFQNLGAQFVLTKLYQTASASLAVEQVASYIPFIGSLVAGALSFAATHQVLQDVLFQMEEEAVFILTKVIESSNK